MPLVNIHEAQSNLCKLIERVENNGEEITICRNGKPVARLVSVGTDAHDPLKKHPDLAGCYFVDEQEACKPLNPEDWPDTSE